MGGPKPAAGQPPASTIVGEHEYASVAAAAPVSTAPPLPPDVSQLVAADLQQAQQYFDEVRCR